MKIQNIFFKNFKQFDQMSIRCRNTNILVGPNNAGKSTLLDGIRICNDVLRYSARKNPTLESQGQHGVCATHHIEHSKFCINILHCVRNYGDEDAEIIFTHENSNELHILIHPSKAVRAFIKSDGKTIRNSTQFRQAFPLEIIIVPTLGPFESEEDYVTDETVNRNENTRLAHRSFRNIIYRKTEGEFSLFKTLASRAWPNVELNFPERGVYPDKNVKMFFSEDRMPREISTSGFGFQVWLQLMLQIMRGKKSSLLVIDEPDIYLHPDLQKKLVRLIKDNFGQIFLATHSSEIINEVDSGDIVSINKNTTKARRITSDSAYREVFNYIGSSENVEFARMARAKRIIFFEGKDRKILRRFTSKLSANGILDDVDTVFLQAGGFGQWRRVKEVGWTLNNVFGMNVKIVAVFDRDYRCEAEIEEFLSNINSTNIKCHVLDRKEVENYALEKEVLVRSICKRTQNSKTPLTASQAERVISDILESMRHQTQSQIIGALITYEKSIRSGENPATTAQKGLKKFEKSWETDEGKLSIIPGKEFVSSVSATLLKTSNSSITIQNIISEMKAAEIPESLRYIITDIEDFLRD